MYPKFNQPLFALAKVAVENLGRPIRVVDVGTAVGDTVLFLEANFPGKVSEYLCIDGDKEFFSFQEFNLKSVREKCVKVFALLTDKPEMVSSIDKKDPTTGSAVGADKEMGRTLDQVIEETGFGAPDLIKIDIDGFDGKALGGATQTLKTHKPLVIFEWNTPYYELVGNDTIQPFEVLEECGYTTFIWVTNLGVFSHIEVGYNKEALHRMAEFERTMLAYNGTHFDVIALPKAKENLAKQIIEVNELSAQISRY